MWDVDAVPDGPAAAAAGLPAGAFLTCSSDGSVRLWALGPTPEGTGDGGGPAAAPPAPRSPGCGAALRVVAAGRELQAVLQLDAAAGAGALSGTGLDGPGPSGDGCGGGEAAAEARCVRVSPDGRWIAVGDRTGNVRVHALAPSLELQVLFFALREFRMLPEMDQNVDFGLNLYAAVQISLVLARFRMPLTRHNGRPSWQPTTPRSWA